MTMTQTELNEIVRLHNLWLIGDEEGKKANLRGADLRGADLNSAANVVSVTGIGSARRMTTYRADTDEIWCGCFKGTLAEFAKKINQTHKDNPEHLAHYRAAVAFFRAYKKNVKPVEKKQQRA